MDERATSSESETWLVIGGAGYVGSHIAWDLHNSGIKTLVLDNLLTGDSERLMGIIPIVIGDCGNSALVHEVILKNNVIGIIHLAALKQARESEIKPILYWDNNVGSMIGTLKGIAGTNVKSFIFSSSCSVYGSAGVVSEATPVNPISAYGHTKNACEKLIQNAAIELKLNYLILRYFNVIGNGEFTSSRDLASESLVPRMHATALKNGIFRVFGFNHKTVDGSCIRDYLDVRDVAAAHKSAVIKLTGILGNQGGPRILNLGSGSPTSVLQTIKAYESVAGKRLNIALEPSQDADPAEVWNNSNLAQSELNWVPIYDLEDSIRSYFGT
jgi:UDP-glucose 4-epimerase